MVGADVPADVVIPETADVTCDAPCDPPTVLLLLLLLLLVLPLTAADALHTPGPLDDTGCGVWVAEDVTCALVVDAETLAPDVADVA